jgi:hypothetical protein
LFVLGGEDAFADPDDRLLVHGSFVTPLRHTKIAGVNQY